MNLEEIRCEIVPIPNSSSSDVPNHALFFHRFGLPEKQSDHQLNKSFHDTISHSFKLVSWFDERIQVVMPSFRNWINKVGASNIFVPVADNVSFSFKLEPRVDQSQDVFFAKDVTTTWPSIQRLHLLPRCLIPITDLNKSDMGGNTKEFSEVGTLSVLTYNMLSEIYLYPEKYFYCPQWALKWEYRRQNLLQEILLYNADILCLQEVQSDHFENFFKPEFAKHGYLAVYKKKTKEVYTGNGYTIDGCATFFRADTFKEVITYELEFSKTALSLIGKLEPSLRDQAGLRLTKDNIALAVILEMSGNAASCAPSLSKLCVVNTHIFASKAFPDVKLLQVSDLINEIEKTAIIDPRMPLFICGDINSVPGSDPYTLLTEGEVNLTRENEIIDPLGIYPHLKLRHSLNLASAYTGEPHKQKTLDYIFHTVDNLEVKGILELPDLDSVGGALPSPLCSSDHIALMANFRITRPFLG